MKLSVAKLLVDKSDGFLNLYENYSGRGMFGRTTSAVNGSQSDFDETISEIIESGTSKERSEIAELIKSKRQDSLGLDLIFY